ncbi:MAG: GNAT family N-acetyltransferase [Chloroflexi bacterium]|nr:GNAT family N-acetyltransferase [Chloroflexota bacterium]
MLKGKRVTLRAVEQGDLATFHLWMNDWEVKRFLAHIYPLSMDEEAEWYEAIQERKDERHFAIEDEAGELIGVVGLRRISPENRSAELGIALGERRVWGQGYGTAAVRAMLDFAFKQMNLHMVWLQTYEFNERAQASFRRCGFREDGRLRQGVFRDGRYWDVVLMSVLREEFVAEQKAEEGQGP